MFNKILFAIASLFVVTIISLFIWIKVDESNPCKGGRDTVAEFGTNCDYAILGTRSDSILFNRKNQLVIEDKVSNYKEQKPYIYVIGDAGYTRVNYVNDEIITNKSLSYFNNRDIEIFQQLEIN